MNIFISGLLTGFSVAAPIGPISMMCINNTLASGAMFGFLTALGASTADSIYGLIAALGFTAVISFSARYHAALQLGGGILIILIGLTKFFFGSTDTGIRRQYTGRNILKEYFLVFSSTLSNPYTVSFFLSVFAAFSGKPAGGQHLGLAFQYAAGIFVGTAAWWLILSLVIGAFNKAISPKAIFYIRKISALMIAAIGVYAILR
jgi:threonine/homoserine/homoserine lactone efflux protein